MKITLSRKIIPEDFAPEDVELIRKLALVINPFLDQTALGLNSNLTIGENFKAKTVNVKLAENETTYKFNWTLNEKPTAIIVGQIFKNTKEPVTQGHSISWQVKDNIVSVNFFGLEASVKHEINLIALV